LIATRRSELLKIKKKLQPESNETVLGRKKIKIDEVSALNMETVCFSETVATTCESKQRQNPE
jgi:hypothetical protein